MMSFWKEMGITVVICTGTRNCYWKSTQPESCNQKTGRAAAYRKDMGKKVLLTSLIADQLELDRHLPFPPFFFFLIPTIAIAYPCYLHKQVSVYISVELSRHQHALAPSSCRALSFFFTQTSPFSKIKTTLHITLFPWSPVKLLPSEISSDNEFCQQLVHCMAEHFFLLTFDFATFKLH